MEKIYVVILVLTILFSVVGCSQSNETPTDMISKGESLVETGVSELETSPVSDVVKNEVTEQDEKEESSAAKNTVSQKNKNSMVSHIEEDAMSSVVENLQTEEDIVVPEDPKFANLAEFEKWLKNQKNTENHFSADALTTMQQGNTLVYLKPNVLSENTSLVFSRIKASADYLFYFYQFADSTDEFRVTVSLGGEDLQELYDLLKKNATEGKKDYYCTERNGITYYYKKQDLADGTVFSWEQYGKTHAAKIAGHFEQIDEILPLLELQQVTVQTNNDHVTQ